MKWLIRAAWLMVTLAIYAPVRGALDTVGTPGALVFLFHVLYFLFVFLVPCRAFVAIYESRHRPPEPPAPREERPCGTMLMRNADHILFPGNPIFSQTARKIVGQFQQFLHDENLPLSARAVMFLTVGALNCCPEVHSHELIRKQMLREASYCLLTDSGLLPREVLLTEATDYLDFLMLAFGQESGSLLQIHSAAAAFSHSFPSSDLSLDSKKELVHRYWLVARYVSDVFSDYDLPSASSSTQP